MPLHFWLPGLHSGAPSQVSAVLSGVMLKMGVYGLVRITGLLPGNPSSWGVALVVVGCFSAVVGITRGLFEGRIKRLLACSSIENIGVITAGLGLAVLGRALGRPDWVLPGLAAALLHTWNHAVFKGLLFLGAGTVMHACGSDRLDRLGGLGRRMPRTTGLIAVGCLAACALPPLNGFASEWLLYMGFFQVIGSGSAGSAGIPFVAIGAAALGLAGALTLATFMKLLGSGLLGAARSEAAARAHDPGPLLAWPMAILALLALGLGPGAPLLLPWITKSIGAWNGSPLPAGAGLAALVAPLWQIGLLALLLAGIGAVLMLRLGVRHRQDGQAPTWDCGYALPDPRMQTTATGLADSIGELLLPGRSRQAPPPRITGPFPAPARLLQARADLLLERRIKPLLSRLAHTLHRLRVFQQGRTEHYVLYILAALLLMLLVSGGQP
jgi:hydrogenase-4 component B